MAIFHQSLQKFPSSSAACLLVHGMNNRPEVLNDITDFLESLALPVVSVCLTGHHHDFNKLNTISKKIWEQDVLEAYQLIRKRNKKIYLLAYSLGAAISLDILSEEIRFDKMVLLAPAIAPRIHVKLLQYIAPLFPTLPLFSIAPKGYNVNPYLPLRAYQVLIQLFHSLRKKKLAYANIPCLLVMDPKDETMSLSTLKKMIKDYHLNCWDILSLDSKNVVGQVKFHHLIIDKNAMGASNWGIFTNSVKTFLAQ